MSEKLMSIDRAAVELASIVRDLKDSRTVEARCRSELRVVLADIALLETCRFSAILNLTEAAKAG